MTIVNIVDCVARIHHVWRKRNTIHMDKQNIMMTGDLHVPVRVVRPHYFSRSFREQPISAR